MNMAVPTFLLGCLKLTHPGFVLFRALHAYPLSFLLEVGFFWWVGRRAISFGCDAWLVGCDAWLSVARIYTLFALTTGGGGGCSGSSGAAKRGCAAATMRYATATMRYATATMRYAAATMRYAAATSTPTNHTMPKRSRRLGSGAT